MAESGIVESVAFFFPLSSRSLIALIQVYVSCSRLDAADKLPVFTSVTTLDMAVFYQVH